MIEQNKNLMSAVFITFAGDCKKALTFYQTLFGGILQFELFENGLQGYTELPVISGSLVADRIVIHGSDMVHNEGRKLGNYISIFLKCHDARDRKKLIKKLASNKKKPLVTPEDDQQLIEVTDAFDVRWILGV